MARRVLIVLSLLLPAPLAAFPDPAPEELREGRRKLQQWRKHPEQFERLRRDAQAFFALPPERREQVLKLDRELHQEPPAVRGRLADVLERYADWLERLDEKDRQRVRAAEGPQDRLRIVRELRDREWLRRQPKAVRQRVEGQSEGKRPAIIRELRQEERERRRAWQLAARFWDELQFRRPLPAHLSDLPSPVQTFVKEYLSPLLSKEEKERLERKQGQWPDYPQTLVELADKHPIALPGPTGPTRLSELPAAVQKSLKGGKGFFFKRIREAEGKWPDFAVAVTELAAKRQVRDWPYELWPTNFKDLSPQVQEFIEKKLRPALDNKDALVLIEAEKKARWPHYPETIRDLARKHGLEVPWQTLPGPREAWDRYRSISAAVGKADAD